MHMSYPVPMTESHSHHAYRAGMSLRAVRKGCFMGKGCTVLEGCAVCACHPGLCRNCDVEFSMFLLPRLGKTCTEVYGEIEKRKEQERVKEAS